MNRITTPIFKLLLFVLAVFTSGCYSIQYMFGQEVIQSIIRMQNEHSSYAISACSISVKIPFLIQIEDLILQDKNDDTNASIHLKGVSFIWTPLSLIEQIGLHHVSVKEIICTYNNSTEQISSEKKSASVLEYVKEINNLLSRTSIPVSIQWLQVNHLYLNNALYFINISGKCICKTHMVLISLQSQRPQSPTTYHLSWKSPQYFSSEHFALSGKITHVDHEDQLLIKEKILEKISHPTCIENWNIKNGWINIIFTPRNDYEQIAGTMSCYADLQDLNNNTEYMSFSSQFTLYHSALMISSGLMQNDLMELEIAAELHPTHFTSEVNAVITDMPIWMPINSITKTKVPPPYALYLRASGPYQQPIYEAHCNVPYIFPLHKRKNYYLEHLLFSSTGSFFDGILQGTACIQGELNKSDLICSAKYIINLHEKTYSLDKISYAHKRSELAGNIFATYNAASPLSYALSGSIKGKLVDIHEIAHFITPKEVTGNIDIACTLSSEKSHGAFRQIIRSLLSGSEIHVDQILASTIHLDNTIYIGKNISSVSKISAEYIDFQKTHLKSILLNMDTENNHLAFNVQTNGFFLGAFNGSIKGTAELIPEAITCSIQNFSGDINGIPYSLSKPVNIFLNSSFLQINNPLRLLCDNGYIELMCNQSTTHEDSSEILLQMHNINLGIINSRLHPNYAGTANLSLHINNFCPSDNNIQGMLRGNVTYYPSDNKQSDELYSVDLHALLQNDTGALNIVYKQHDKEIGHLNVEGPFKYSTFEFMPYSVKTYFKGNLNGIAPLFDIDIAGNVLLEMNMANGNRQSAFGSFHMDNGFIFIPHQGIYIRNITLEASKEEFHRKITISHLHADDGEEGNMSGQGIITLLPSHQFKLFLQLQKFCLIDTPFLKTVLSGLGIYEGSLKSGKLIGDFELNKWFMSFENPRYAMVPEVLNIDWSEGYAPIDFNIHLPNILVDIRVRADKSAHFEGKGISSLWSGNITVTGDILDPICKGRLTLDSGEYKLIHRRFALIEGLSIFPEGKLRDYTLHACGELQIQRFKLFAHVNKEQETWTVTLNSIPYLPDHDIISLLIFDKISDKSGEAYHSNIANAIWKLGVGRSDSTILKALYNHVHIEQFSTSHTKNTMPNDFIIKVGTHIFPNSFLGIAHNLRTDPKKIQGVFEASFEPVTLHIEGNTDHIIMGLGISINL